MVYVVIAVISLALCVSLYFNFKFSMTLLQIEDALEDCLDTIDSKYSKMSEILSRPLFYDSPEVRRVVEDVRDTRNALHRIALALSSNFEALEEDKQNDNDRQEEDQEEAGDK